MWPNFSMPSGIVPVSLLKPAADSGGRTSGNYASLKNAVRAILVVYITQGASNTVQIDPVQATAVAGTGTKALSNAVKIWHNQDADTAASTWTEATAAVNFTTSAATKTKIICFDIQPELALDVAGGFDCIGVTTGASSASNITSAMLYILPRYAQEQPIDALTD